MRAFEVYLNDQKLCLGGVGDDGVLTTIVNWVAKNGRGDLFLTVGGLVSSVEFVNWAREALAVGDIVTVKIVEANSTDAPRARKRAD